MLGSERSGQTTMEWVERIRKEAKQRASRRIIRGRNRNAPCPCGCGAKSKRCRKQ